MGPSDCFHYCQNCNCTAVLKFVKCRVMQVWSTDAYDNENLALHVVRPNYLVGSIYKCKNHFNEMKGM